MSDGASARAAHSAAQLAAARRCLCPHSCAYHLQWWSNWLTHLSQILQLPTMTGTDALVTTPSSSTPTRRTMIRLCGLTVTHQTLTPPGTATRFTSVLAWRIVSAAVGCSE